MEMSILANMMVDRADADGLPADHDLRIHAQAVNEAMGNLYVTGANPTTVNTLRDGLVAAGECWSEYSGMPLI